MKTLKDILPDDRKIEVFFDLIKINVDYCFLIRDVLNSELKSRNNYRYIICNCKSYEPMPDINIESNEEFLLNFPEKAFIHAIDRYTKKIKFEKGDDLFVLFRRLTKKKIEFIKLEIIKKERE